MSHQHSGHVAIPGCAWALITVPSIATLSFAQMSVSSQAEFLPFLGISAAGNCTAAVTAPCRLQTGHRHGRHPSRPRQAACARTTPPAAELPALPCTGTVLCPHCVQGQVLQGSQFLLGTTDLISPQHALSTLQDLAVSKGAAPRPMGSSPSSSGLTGWSLQ